jgi:hypothetical protein
MYEYKVLKFIIQSKALLIRHETTLNHDVIFLLFLHVNTVLSIWPLHVQNAFFWHMQTRTLLTSLHVRFADHRSRARNVFARSNTRIVGSNQTRGMDVCFRLFRVCVVLCVGSGLASG